MEILLIYKYLKIIQKVQPDEIYNLYESHVAVSFESPEYTANCDAVFAIIRIHKNT